MRYARSTTVTTDRSKVEIESTLMRYGCESFGYMVKNNKAMIAFEYEGRGYRVSLPLPNKDDQEFTQTETGRARKNKDAVYLAYEQGCRSRWRALLILIKGKIEYLEITGMKFEQGFAGELLLPNGTTLNEFYMSDVLKSIDGRKKMPPLLPG